MKKIIMGATLAVATVAIVSAPAFAATTTSWNQTVQVTSNSVVTLTTPSTPTATIPADPSVNNGFGTYETPLTVASNNASGYNLTLSMISTDANAGALFDGTSGTTDTVDPVTSVSGAKTPTALTANKWGYNLVTGSTNTAPTSATLFTRVPYATAPDKIIDTTAEGTTSVFVNYGVVIDYTLESGYTYANQVTYTASVNP